MLIGFSGRLGATKGVFPSDKINFSVKGKKLIFSSHISGVYVDGIVIEYANSNLANNCGYFCGYITNINKIITLLANNIPNLSEKLTYINIAKLIYEIYGPDGFKLLDGLFVGMFISAGKGVMFASKTPGPLLYYFYETNKGELFVSSELKAFPNSLKKLRSFEQIIYEPTIDRAANTCLCNVKRITAGQCIEVNIYYC